MRLIRWGAIVVVAAVTLGLSGCALFNVEPANTQRALDDVTQVSGVTKVSHVSLELGEATIIVPADDDAGALLAVRDRINKRLTQDGLADATSMFTIARGMDRIQLDAPLAQFAYLEQLRHEKPAIGVRLNPPSDSINAPNVVVIVARKEDVVAGYHLVQSTDTDPSIATGTLIVGAETPDGRYELAHESALGVIDYLPLANQLIADPALVGAKVLDGSDNVGADVTVHVRTQAAVPAAWVHYNTVMDSYHFFPLVGVDAPHLTSSDDLEDPTTAQLRVLGLAIASGAVDGDVDMRSDLNDHPQIVFTTSSLANAKKLNALVLSRPDIRTDLPGGFRVIWDHGTYPSPAWNFGKPSKT